MSGGAEGVGGGGVRGSRLRGNDGGGVGGCGGGWGRRGAGFPPARERRWGCRGVRRGLAAEGCGGSCLRGNDGGCRGMRRGLAAEGCGVPASAGTTVGVSGGAEGVGGRGVRGSRLRGNDGGLHLNIQGRTGSRHYERGRHGSHRAEVWGEFAGRPGEGAGRCAAHCCVEGRRHRRRGGVLGDGGFHGRPAGAVATGCGVAGRARGGPAAVHGGDGVVRPRRDGAERHGLSRRQPDGTAGGDSDGGAAREGAHRRRCAGPHPGGTGRGPRGGGLRLPGRDGGTGSHDAGPRRVGHDGRRAGGGAGRGAVRDLHGRGRHLHRRPAHRDGGAEAERDRLRGDAGAGGQRSEDAAALHRTGRTVQHPHPGGLDVQRGPGHTDPSGGRHGSPQQGPRGWRATPTSRR